MDELNATANATNATTMSPQGVIIAYSGLYTMALASIFYGALRSAELVRKHRREKKKMENSITFDDAKWFPITASCVLFGLYCLFKKDEIFHFLASHPYTPGAVAGILHRFHDKIVENASNLANSSDSANSTLTEIKKSVTGFLTKENISYFLLIFFCYEGVFAMGHLLKPLVVRVLKLVPENVARKITGEFYHYRVSFTRASKQPVEHNHVDKLDDGPNKALFDGQFDTHDVVSVIMCSVFGILHVTKRHWLTNNAFGLAFTLYGIEALHLSSFKAGAVLLAGLFVYDIFWVFATEVMSTVATSVNAPILLMFPQDLMVNGIAKSSKFAMLGLGDIVIPGIFLALLLRFGEKEKKKIYFYATMAAYALGLMLTIGVMHYFKAAQPALLYLVPACIGAPSLLAFCMGDFGRLWSYDEEDLVKKEDKDKEKEKKQKQHKDDGSGKDKKKSSDKKDLKKD